MSILKKLGEIMARIKAFLFTGPAKASDPGQQSQVNQLTAPLFQPNAAFYGSTVTVDGLLFAGLFAPDATFYGPTITTGTALVAPLFAPSASFYSATVNQSLVAARYSASDTFYSPIVGTGTFLAAPLFAPTASFYAPSLNLNLTAPLVTASSTFFGLAITPANSLAAGLFAPTATFYSPSIGLRLVAPLLTANTTFRTATISMAQIPGQALSTPVVTLTSSQPPEADITMGSDIYAGYFLRIQRSADGVKNASDGTYTNATLNITHQVTPSEVAVSEITQDDLDPDGYFDPAGAWFQQYRWERDDGAISAWSNEISGTSSGSVAAFSKVTGVNKTRYLTMTSNLAGAMNTTVNALRLVRTTIPKTGKGHFEIEIDALSAVTTVNGSIGLGITDAASNLDLISGTPAPGLNAPGLRSTSGADRPQCSFAGTGGRLQERRSMPCLLSAMC
jgi:hypothetical protein